MKLYIKIEDGLPINHPVLEENLLQIYKSVSSIPSNYEPFVRVDEPVPDYTGMFRKIYNETSIYEKVDDTWTDIWTVIGHQRND
jgi:hypothetical protein